MSEYVIVFNLKEQTLQLLLFLINQNSITYLTELAADISGFYLYDKKIHLKTHSMYIFSHKSTTKKQGMLLLTSLLAGLSLLGFMVIAAGLFYARVIPRWQSAFIFAGNAIIIVFMDIDNLMLVGSILWFIGVLPFLKMHAIRYQRIAGKSGIALGTKVTI